MDYTVNNPEVDGGRPPEELIQLFSDPAFDGQPGGSGGSLTLFRATLREASAALNKRFHQDEHVTALVHHHAWVVDQLLVRAWRLFMPAQHPDIALVAVGGYGRGELHPHSDIDVLILLRDEQQDQFKVQIERLVMFLWDIGLQIGHSVRSLQECRQLAAEDITIATTLMESRLLAGPHDLYTEMRRLTGPYHIWPSRDFFEAKWREQIARHYKYHDTAHNLEPNVKEGPGGLRDIQMIGWVAKRHFGADTLQDLVKHGFLTDAEYAALIDGQHFLWRVRYALHLMNNRREDRLLFDYQAALARQFGYKDNHRLAVEQFMKDYYMTIMELSRLNEMLLQLFQEAILYADAPVEVQPINRRFRIRNDFIEATSDKVFQRYPFALLEIFLILQQRPDVKGVRASTIRLIRNHRYMIDDSFRNDLRCRSLFLEIIRQPQGITHELRRMHRYGVLAAYLPAFGRIVGLMQYDLFHVYTVDEHILMVIRNLRRFTVPPFADELPLCSEIAQRLSKPEVLYLAGMFHDIAKGSGHDHSDAGSDEAMAFCRHHGMSDYDSRLVAWLVKYHLLMSMTAQRQDIDDPEIIMKFATIVSDTEHLDYLYLLTVADIRGTNPALWTSWKGALLADLYHGARRALLRGLGAPLDVAAHIANAHEQALALLRQHPLDEIHLKALWDTLDSDYFLLHSPEEIAWHGAQIMAVTDADLPLISIREQTRRGATELFIYARDEDHLFAITTKTLDQLGLNIADARIFTTPDGHTLDTYIVLDEQGRAIRDDFRIKEIIPALKSALSTPYDPSLRVTRRPARQLRHFLIPTQVTYSTDEGNQHTVMEVIASDRPGLLSQVGQAMVECGVRLKNAKIATFGARVEDVFFITDGRNQPLRSQATRDQLTTAIKNRLDRQRKEQDAASTL
jgi:[protein-PII] uridylyltransferase